MATIGDDFLSGPTFELERIAGRISSDPSISADGRYVVFWSTETSLVAGDSNGVADVFRKDTLTGEVIRVSVQSDGTQLSLASKNPVISADGRHVAFETATARGAGIGDFNFTTVVKDLNTGELRPLATNMNAAGLPFIGLSPSISGDGRFVAFTSGQIYVKDFQTGAIASVSSGTEAGNGLSAKPVISADGSSITFETAATNLVPGDTNGLIDLIRATNPLISVPVELAGGPGNDVYLVRATETVVEKPTEGHDTVRTFLPFYALPPNVEDLELLAGGIGQGNELDNRLIGKNFTLGPFNYIVDRLEGLAGDDVLVGFERDRLVGGVGNDTYIASPDTLVIESPGEGIDTFVAITSLFPTAFQTLPAEVENLILSSNDFVTGTGNNLDNIILGNSRSNILVGLQGRDRLDGQQGADDMMGGPGDDWYVVDDAGDIVEEQAGEGVDTVESRVDYVLDTNVENLVLVGSPPLHGTGNAGSNQIVANIGDSFIDGGAGVDTVSYEDSPASVAIDLAITTAQITHGSGSDTLKNIENIVGSAFDDSLKGNAAANTLNGSHGVDTMAGARGNDQYSVDDPGDVVLENPGEGDFDSISSTVSYTLPENVERLVLLANQDLEAFGNDLDNRFIPNSGSDQIDGGAGSDTVFYFNNNGPVNGFLPGRSVGRIDKTYVDTAGVTQTRSDTLIDIENLIGSAFDDEIAGNGQDNQLEGGAGNDAIDGNSGTDTVAYIYATGGVHVDLRTPGFQNTVGAGSDMIRNVENILGSRFDDVLTGDAGANVLNGAIGSDRLTGGAGNDTLTGGPGVDFFVFDSRIGTDTVTDFHTLGDRLVIDQAGIRVGDGDTLVEGATMRAAPGGFSPSAELTIFRSNIAGTIDANSAAAKIGAATSAYAPGATAVFAVDNGVNSAVFLFTSAAADALVSGSELHLLAVAAGTPATNVSDYLFT